MEVHNIEPLYDAESRILILGSFPSVKSRQQQFFYGHPQNRFWKVMAAIFHEPVPVSIAEKKRLLHEHHVANWDVIQSCEIRGSADDSISDVTANDLSVILNNSPIRKILCNGTKSFDLYMKYIYPQTKIMPIKMPSTSPANASWSLERLTEVWRKEFESL